MRFLILLFSVCLIASLPACSTGSKLATAKVKGNLLFNGTPFVSKHNGSLTVKFIPIVEEGQPFDTFIADVNREDGSFVVVGRAEDGIPVGKYRISIDQMVMNMPPEVEAMNRRFSPEVSRIIREITGNETIQIDLAKAEGQ